MVNTKFVRRRSLGLIIFTFEISYREESKRGLAKLQNTLLDPIVDFIDEFLKIRLKTTTGIFK
jgi:chaperone required for assembly of F1-ATPase